MSDRRSDELEILWKRLQKCPPEWKDIYATYQFAKRASEAVKELEKENSELKHRAEEFEKSDQLMEKLLGELQEIDP